MSTEPLELDQEDFEARTNADSYFSDITVKAQRKGVTENDISIALGPLNEKGGKIGAIVIVLMPVITPDPAQTPSARFFVRQTFQVIANALFNDGEGGTGKSAEQIGERLRQIHHFQSFGRPNTWTFDGMDPIERPPGELSYGVHFKRLGGDSVLRKVAVPSILATNERVTPCTVTLACATEGAAIWYTTDGSYPSSVNPAATLYTEPFELELGDAATVRAAAQLAGAQQSDLATLAITEGEEPEDPVVNPTGVGMVLIIGQSNGEGADALPLLSTTPQTRNFMFAPAVNNPAGDIGEVTGLVETETTDIIFENQCGETIASSMAKMLDTIAPYKLLFGGVCIGGQRYLSLKKGQPAYTQGLAMLAAFHAAANNSGLGKPQLGVLAIPCLFGEADNAFEITNHAEHLLEWHGDWNGDFADFYADKGVDQREAPLLACQHASLPMNLPVADTRFQLLEGHKANPGKIVCIGPRYHLRHIANLHLCAHAQRQHAFTYSKAMKRIVTDELAWEPVRPLSVNRSGAVITIVFHVPVGPLVFDRARVFDPNEFYGFEYYDDDTSAAIQAVAITAADTVQITLDGAPTGANKLVRYAWANSPFLGNGAGPLRGRRGCLRDSDPATLLGYESFNWCVHFSEPVT